MIAVDSGLASESRDSRMPTSFGSRSASIPLLRKMSRVLFVDVDLWYPAQSAEVDLFVPISCTPILVNIINVNIKFDKLTFTETLNQRFIPTSELCISRISTGRCPQPIKHWFWNIFIQ